MSDAPIQVDLLPIVRREDIAGDLLARIPSDLRLMPRWQAYVAAWGAELQELEDAAFLMVADGRIDTAQGVLLDRMGAYVDEQRLGLEDSAYRRFIKARIRVNGSDGGHAVLGDVLTLLTQPISITLMDAYPAGVTGYVFVTALFDDAQAARIGAMARRAVSEGVALGLVASRPDGLILSSVSEGAAGLAALNGPGLAQRLD